jgi:hypothetical protein
MFAFFAFTAQLAVASASASYANPAVERLVKAASAVNARVPSALAAFTARAEGQALNAFQFSTGREMLFGGAEGYAWNTSWSRERYELHLIGRRGNPRVQKSGISDEQPWLIPHLYGDRFPFSLPIPRRSATLRSPVHPFAAGADQLYEYSGGDTVAQIETHGRRILLLVIHVRPKADRSDEPVFDGDIYLDADRYQIVRLAGRFKVRGHSGLLEARVDIENAEINGELWLPHYERIEMELRSPLLMTPYITRLSATISAYAVTWAPDSTTQVPRNSSVIETKAARDSLDGFDEWTQPLTRFDPQAFNEFVDAFAGGTMRVAALPSFRVGVSRPANAFHYNRVEGFFTGSEATIVPGAIATGWLMRFQAGYAWTEATLRGALTVERHRDRSIFSLDARRSIVSTSDFPSSEALAVLSEVLPLGRPDYVDRTTITGGTNWLLSKSARTFVSIRAGVGRDHDAPARTRGMFALDSAVVPDRFAASGSYGITILDAGAGRIDPLRTPTHSLGTVLHVEVATGQLRWARVTSASQVRIAGRRMIYTARVDAGAALSSALPPQQLFELGGADRLPGYAYKQFVGDRAVVGGANIELPLSIAKHFGRRIERRGLPPLAPAVAVSIQAGWTTLSTSSESSVGLLTRGGVLSTPSRTDGIVGSGSLGITLFSGALHAGLARSLEAAGSWRPALGFLATL